MSGEVRGATLREEEQSLLGVVQQALRGTLHSEELKGNKGEQMERQVDIRYALLDAALKDSKVLQRCQKALRHSPLHFEGPRPFRPGCFHLLVEPILDLKSDEDFR